MVLPRSVLGTSRYGTENLPRPDYRAIAVTVPQAIAVAEAAAGGSVSATGIELREIEGRLYYQVSTAKSGSHLIDAVTGARLAITEDFARQMAARMAGGKAPRAVSVVQRHEGEYTIVTFPAYRMDFDDAASTVVYVSQVTGEMSAIDRKGRMRGFLAEAHTFGFLRPELSARSVRALLILTSVVGLLMVFFGGWILCIQFQIWRERRASA